MSDHHYTLAAPAVPQTQLGELHGRVLDWLVAEGIVERELTDCVLSSKSLGHRPAPGFMSASSMPEDSQCTNGCYALFIESAVNGLEIIEGRHITVSGEGSYECALCPACGGEGPVFSEAWNAAASEWLEWRGPGNLGCADCGESRSIVDWEHREPIGFGALTFNFWNWPPLSEEFQAKLSQRLGYPVRLLNGSY